MIDLGSLDTAGLRQVAISMLAAWLMGQAIAEVYRFIHRGRERSAAFVQALVVGGIVGAMLMLAIGNSVARGIGIVGALALIRFRTNLSNPLDMVFIFASFAGGIAAGTGNIVTGAVGTALFLAVVAGTSSLMQARGVREAELRVRMPASAGAEDKLRSLLRLHAATFALLRRRDSPEGKDCRSWWRVALKDGDDGGALTRVLLAEAGATEVQVELESAAPEAGAGDDD
ncbi:MAG: hypothetical protein A2138_00010 [Deltaproteobacteria bacterium RBG_16_71_12]|nr:MAG: hypothetical protein A2138_00010 [Deltaproteobacteria bacterium RBG_16_71_12]